MGHDGVPIFNENKIFIYLLYEKELYILVSPCEILSINRFLTVFINIHI